MLNQKMEANMNHQEDINALWEKSQENHVIKELLAGREIKEIMENLSGFKEAFLSQLDEMDCSDERVPAKIGKKIGFAGQLILASEEEIENFVKNYKGRVDTVTSHDDCGAAKIKFEDLEKKSQLPENVKNGDELGILHSKKMAEDLGAEWIHITKSEMSSEIHNARAVCFDGTGKFNPSVISEMPEAFVCSAPGFGLSKDYCQTELKTLIEKVAFGSHGFGEKFTPETPLYVIVSAKNKKELNKLSAWAEDAVQEFGSRVKIKGFIAPER